MHYQNVACIGSSLGPEKRFLREIVVQAIRISIRALDCMTRGRFRRQCLARMSFFSRVELANFATRRAPRSSNRAEFSVDFSTRLRLFSLVVAQEPAKEFVADDLADGGHQLGFRWHCAPNRNWL